MNDLSVNIGMTMWPKQGFPERFEYMTRVWDSLDENINGADCSIKRVISAETCRARSRLGVSDVFRPLLRPR